MNNLEEIIQELAYGNYKVGDYFVVGEIHGQVTGLRVDYPLGTREFVTISFIHPKEIVRVNIEVELKL